MNKLFTVIVSLFFLTSIYGQGLQDALRFSLTSPGGTARTIGAGGAFGALGGDFGSITINPAGLGTYRASEFVISPAITSRSVTSIMQGTNQGFITEESHLGLENLGIVLAHNPIGSDWYSSNLAIGFNKIANFNSDYFFGGKTIGGIAERFEESADGRSVDQLDDFEGYPAYITGAIFDFDEDLDYDTDLTGFPDQQVYKEQVVQQRGSINELSITWAGNYKNKMSVGVGLGVPFISYEESKIYSESDDNNEVDFFDRLEYIEYLNTTGTGFNIKAGMIYTPIRALRLGLSFQSPTWYFLTDDYFTELTYGYTDNSGTNESTQASPDGTFQYRFSAPWIVTASAGTLYRLGEIQGFLSADVEYRDYSSGSFNLTSSSNLPSDRTLTRELNAEIDKQLATSTTLRLGTELAFKKLRVRGGIQIRQSVFAIDDKATDSNMSLGLGLREDRFFIDLAYAGGERSEGYLPYLTSNESRNPFVENDISTDNLILTLGYKF
jgi:hypothetical protein